LTRAIDAWLAAAVALVAGAAGACLLAHGVLPRYTLAWWVPLVPAGSAVVILAVIWSSVRAQRDTANRQRLAVDAQRLENERSQRTRSTTRSKRCAAS
jgi:membrane protein implicated in regulation of membrane protease activity